MVQLRSIRLRVNGRPVSGNVEPRRLLADFLREDLGLTGTHLGCEHGVCGACTVLVDGEATRACLMFACQADDKTVITVEGLAQDDTSGETLSPLQRAFHEHHALQCGYCTPGFLITATALLANNPDPTAEEVREAISGNLCRCTGYVSIVEAILAAAREIRRSSE
jgi:carbon-monoxide dehydrogenase small subunit